MSGCRSRRWQAGLAATFAAVCLAAAVRSAWTQTLCAEVKLVLSQKAALEREAFNAQLQVNNALPDQALQNLKVDILINNSNGADAGQMFFVKVSTLQNTTGVNADGTIQPNTSATINWLIIPSTGAGGANPLGQQYGVKANITYNINGASTTITTFEAPITVHPQPTLKLEYVLPYEVFGDEPLTENTIEPVEPFPLGVRVTNVGYGTANNFQIDSAQPKIVANDLSLNVNIKLIGTVLSGAQVPNTLFIPFGTLAPNAVSMGEWTMTSSLSGRFISFTSTFTHAADLGGQLTSLIQSVTTYTLLKDVLVDQPNRDKVPEFLVNESMDRETMQTALDNGTQPTAEYILESDQQVPLPVTEVNGRLAGTLGGTNASLTYSFANPVSPNIWIHSSVLLQSGKGLVIASARRSDGKVMDLPNVWVSKHFIKDQKKDVYWLNIMDLTSQATSYTIQFEPSALDFPPGAVTDLAAVTVSSGGTTATSSADTTS
jgi:hypothetical protein